MNLSDITEPTLLIDQEQCRENIRQMIRKARQHRINLNPHFKTHQSRIIGEWFSEEGEIGKITVSSIRMARYFKQAGWRDITVAFPINTRQINAVNDLAENINLTIFVNNTSAAREVDKQLNAKVNVYTEIDTGYHRSGIPYDNLEEIERQLDQFFHSKLLDFKGFYTHAGQTYNVSNQHEIAEIHGVTLHRLNQLRKQLSGKFPDIKLSIGDTPSCSTVNNFAGVHSIHPGNFVFYDLNQHRIGSCSIEQIAVALACPVVSRRPERHELILQAGAVHLSKQYELLEGGEPHYGFPVTLHESGWGKPWKDSHIRSLSQEHGILKCNADKFEEFSVGDLVGILPIHSCLTCNLMGGYYTFDGTALDHLEQAEF